MDDYLAKPVRAAELLAAIDRATGAGRMKDEGRTMKDSTLSDASGLAYPDELDPAALLGACDGDEVLLRKMCQHFRSFVPDRLAEVSTALRDRDSARLGEAAHKLGGMVSSFSATAAAEAALLGQLGREGKIEEAIQAHNHLTEIVEKVIAVLDTLSVEQLRRLRGDSPESTTRR
jgi:HPt (histidine-containing phosphotransfer) domain-containing protein